ncbi:MAG: methylenetetrahydrofolate reductase C-terminal domain-containing protein, partial [Candidatus Subteraquimicrobiales bacterium]|nr:methylenetetrahydrofolate reductase C-terminal domain-containing protein [Candidatus Subteraquimicrobiales bacterium]
YKKVLVAGCNTCVAICFAGGEKEVGILASALRISSKLDGKEREIVEETIQRQCEPEFIEELSRKAEKCDSILSMACGAGVDALAERFPEKRVLPALNTKFIGVTEKPGVWSERCVACGNCVLWLTGGICPIARCAKGLLNGPCGGSRDGKCEVSPDVPCAWQLVYNRLKGLGLLKLLDEVVPPKDWSTSGSGGPRKIVREDLQL